MSGVEKLVIRASAGTGKTFDLVRRYMDALEGKGECRPCMPEEIIAVTFTRKAAAELKQRICAALYRQGACDMASRVGGAYIGTVHGVCLRLLQEYALEAGISPRADELSEEDAEAMFEQASVPFVEEYGDAAALFSSFGLDRVKYSEKKTKPEDQWKNTAHDILTAARTGGMEQRLEEMAERSCREMERYFACVNGLGEPLESVERDLRAAWEEQRDLGNYVKSSRTGAITKKVLAYHTFVKSLPVGHMRWKDWFSLMGRPLDSGNAAFGEELTELGLRALATPEFHRDVMTLIRRMFGFAEDCRKRFQLLKQQSGVVDFADMEQLAVKALREPAVLERIRGRFRMLLVDEYQDTSPMQLSIFNRLCRILGADGRVVFVGDDKQSIYGFRGAAPELTRRGTEGWNRADLTVCHRSLPAILRFTNAFFNAVNAPLRDALLKNDEELAVQSYLEESSDAPYMTQEARRKVREQAERLSSVQFWLVEGTAKTAKKVCDAAVARAVKRLLEEQTLVYDKERGEFRAVQAGDVAVLCRTGDDCCSVADALEALGLRACVSRKGLLDQEEVRLCLRACRVAADGWGSQLDLAELYHLFHPGGDWFEAASARNLEEGIPCLQALRALHERAWVLTPSELLDEVMDVADAFRLVSSWSRGLERRANLEALRVLAKEYESAMHSRREPVTMYGWFDWLEAQKPGMASGGESAVQVWTLHASKGLQRPVVLLHGFSFAPDKGSAWGVKVHADSQAPQDDPLSAQELFWLPSVFASLQKKDLSVPDAYEPLASAVKSAEDRYREASLREELRLLYVGMTRAESVLIVTGRFSDKKGVLLEGLSCFLNAEAAETVQSLQEGEGDFFGEPCLVRMLKLEESGGEETDCRTAGRFPTRPERAVRENPLEEVPASRASSLWSFADAVPVAASDEVARSELGNMIHAWLTLWFGMSREKREREQSSGRWMERRRAFCALWNEQMPIWPDAEYWLDKAAERLCEEVEKRWEPARTRREGDRLVWRTEWPLEVCREMPEGELRRTMRVDMLVELRHEDGTCGPCLIIDHKCGDYARFATEEALSKHLQEAYAVQMAGYLQAFADMGRECQCWMHLPLEGKMLEFSLQPAATA